MSPEEHRDKTISQVLKAGGTITSVTPLSTFTDPSIIVAYQITAGATTPEILAAVQLISSQTTCSLDHSTLTPYYPQEETID